VTVDLQSPDVAAAQQFRRSPLGVRASELASADAAFGDAVRLREIAFLTMIDVRVDPATPAGRRIGEFLGIQLPTTPNTVGRSERAAALWLSPDEWLIVSADSEREALLAGLRQALGADSGAVIDLSANRTTVELSGTGAREVLEKGCTIDLHPRSFHPGDCAQTTLARTQIILWQLTDEPVYRLLVRGSFAGYLADWLLDAARETIASQVNRPTG
jgi:sarcosine oxidase subunit gamma